MRSSLAIGSLLSALALVPVDARAFPNGNPSTNSGHSAADPSSTKVLAAQLRLGMAIRTARFLGTIKGVVNSSKTAKHVTHLVFEAGGPYPWAHNVAANLHDGLAETHSDLCSTAGSLAADLTDLADQHKQVGLDDFAEKLRDVAHSVLLVHDALLQNSVGHTATGLHHRLNADATAESDPTMPLLKGSRENAATTSHRAVNDAETALSHAREANRIMTRMVRDSRSDAESSVSGKSP